MRVQQRTKFAKPITRVEALGLKVIDVDTEVPKLIEYVEKLLRPTDYYDVDVPARSILPDLDDDDDTESFFSDEAEVVDKPIVSSMLPWSLPAVSANDIQEFGILVRRGSEGHRIL